MFFRARKGKRARDGSARASRNVPRPEVSLGIEFLFPHVRSDLGMEMKKSTHTHHAGGTRVAISRRARPVRGLSAPHIFHAFPTQPLAFLIKTLSEYGARARTRGQDTPTPWVSLCLASVISSSEVMPATFSSGMSPMNTGGCAKTKRFSKAAQLSLSLSLSLSREREREREREGASSNGKPTRSIFRRLAALARSIARGVHCKNYR